MELKWGSVSLLSAKAYLIDPLKQEEQIKSIIQLAKEFEAFSGKKGEVCAIHDYSNKTTTLLAGIGDGGMTNSENVRRAVAKLIQLAESKKIKTLGIYLKGCPYEIVQVVAETVVMSSYRYIEYLSNPVESNLKSVLIESDPETEIAVLEGRIIGQAVCTARNLVNEPSNVQTPEKLADEVCKLGKECGFEVEVYGPKDIHSFGMAALEAVGKGSPNPPRLIVMRYKGDPELDSTVGLIGKGVTFDSGGLNLKSGQRFITMKHDMAGGGTVIGAMCAIARLKRRVNVTAIVAAVENLISGIAYKPGDIIGSMAGKTIQVNSTDAEGRLTLVDAITYAIQKEHVSSIVDIGTLTGAARKIMGEFGAPVLGNSEKVWKKLEIAAERAGELVFRIPLVEDARSKMKGDVSDLVNTSLAETGGMVTAALFMDEFIDGTPWMHIDAAGPLWLDKDMPYTPKGGSGWGVRTLINYASSMQ